MARSMAAPIGVSPSASSCGGMKESAVMNFCSTLHRAESDDGHLDAFRRHGIAAQLARELVETGVELLDLRALHRAGRIEQQQAGAARLGIVGEFEIAERYLVECGHSGPVIAFILPIQSEARPRTDSQSGRSDCAVRLARDLEPYGVVRFVSAR